MDFNLKDWAIKIGYKPVNDNESELAHFLRTRKQDLYYLTRSAAINQEIAMLNWLEKYDLLVPEDVVISVAAHGIIPMVKHCIDKGYDTSECCSIAFRNNHFHLLKWLKDNSCKCNRDQHYHGYEGILLQDKINALSIKTDYDDLRHLYISGFDQFPAYILEHHIRNGYPRDKEWLLEYCNIECITENLINMMKETDNNKLVRLVQRRYNLY
jgi:hypothetical protein